MERCRKIHNTVELLQQFYFLYFHTKTFLVSGTTDTANRIGGTTVSVGPARLNDTRCACGRKIEAG